MNYDESLAYIESLAPTILNPDLTRLAAFMKLHGEPQNSYPTLHVAGTNGKGSCVAIIDSVLRAAGFRVGRFTGPHLLRWNERFHVDGNPIDDETFARIVTQLRSLSEEFGARHPEHGKLTWFELLTATAFFFFAEQNVDFAVVEVGLGGRWDATNVIAAPTVCGITTIDLDHTHILGNTVSEIAAEKAGIIKRNVPVVTGTMGDALQVISNQAFKMEAPLYSCVAPNTVTGPTQLNISGSQFDRAAENLSLIGPHQRLNALVAFAMLAVTQQRLGKQILPYLSDGFATVYWPGRFQWLPDQRLLLDGAHNVAGARALRIALDAEFAHNERLFVLSIFQNKNALGALKALIRAGDRVIACQAKTSRAVFDAEAIVQHARSIGAIASVAPSVNDALAQALAHRKENEIVVATGSFATVKESMVALGWHTVEDGIQATLRRILASSSAPSTMQGCRMHTSGGLEVPGDNEGSLI